MTSFETARDALKAMDEFTPTIIVSDLSMSGLTGIDFVRQVRQRAPERGGAIPAVAITAHYEDFAEPLARAAGFSAYLAKPLRWEGLCRVVADLNPTRTAGASGAA